MTVDLDSFLLDIQEFLSYKEHEFFRSQWFENDKISLYLRLGHRCVDQNLRYSALDLASISIHPDFQNSGIFSRILDKLETINTRQIIYVENILSERFKNFFLKRGYRELPALGSFGPSHAYKLTSEKRRES